MAESPHTAFRVWLTALVGVLAVLAFAGPVRAFLVGTGAGAGAAADAGAPIVRVANDDAGDAPATTTYDGPMVHRRTAIGIRPAPGADRAAIGRQLRAAAVQEKVGPLTDASFAVFSAELLTYLVPEIVVVLPEGASAEDAEVVMKDHTYPTVDFYLVESVLVHDVTFAVVAGAVPPATVRERLDTEGVPADSLGHHTIDVQPAGVTVSYFGALISDGQILAVREAMARAAQVPLDRVVVEPAHPGAGVDLATDRGPAGGSHQHE